MLAKIQLSRIRRGTLLTRRSLGLSGRKERVPHALFMQSAGDPGRDGQRCVVDSRAIARAQTAAARNTVPRTAMPPTMKTLSAANTR